MDENTINSVMSKLWKLNLTDLLSAFVSGLAIAALAYLSNLTSIFSVNTEQLIGAAVLGAIVSVLKKFVTDENGMLVGKFKWVA